MAARTTKTQAPSNSFFGDAGIKARGRNGRKADAAANALLDAGSAAKGSTFSVPVSSVTKNGTVTEITVAYNGANVTLTYNKVKGWAERNGRKLASKGMGFYLNPAGDSLTVSTVES